MRCKFCGQTFRLHEDLRDHLNNHGLCPDRPHMRSGPELNFSDHADRCLSLLTEAAGLADGLYAEAHAVGAVNGEGWGTIAAIARLGAGAVARRIGKEVPVHTRQSSPVIEGLRTTLNDRRRSATEGLAEVYRAHRIIFGDRYREWLELKVWQIPWSIAFSQKSSSNASEAVALQWIFVDPAGETVWILPAGWEEVARWGESPPKTDVGKPDQDVGKGNPK